MNFNLLFNKLTPRVTRRVLLFVAFIMWGFAGFKILYISYQSFMEIKAAINYYLIIPLIAAGYFLFFRFLFLKIFLKHTSRIINKEKEWNCLFSFLDLKSYLIMICMITMGITLRKFHLIPLMAIGITYAIMGLTLFTAALFFLSAGMRFKKYRERYKVMKD